MTALSDKDILEDIRKGNLDAFSTLVHTYSPAIVRMIRAKLFVPDDADDLVQNTFIEFYKILNRFDDSKPILPYLYAIARNELKMYYRSHKETVSLDEQFASESFREMDIYIEDVINTLSPEQQKIITMLYEGYSYKEIASAISRPLNTVRTLIRRARLLIKSKNI